MTKYDVVISVTALRQLDSLGKRRESIKSALKELETNPFEPRHKADIKKLHKLSKHEFYRLRVGEYRIVYNVEMPTVKIVKIFAREKGYKWLE